MGISLIMINAIVPHKRDIDIYWSTFAPLIEKALAYSGGEHTLEDIKQDWQTGKQVFIGIYEREKILAVISVEMICFPQKTIMNIPIVAGEQVEKWLDYALEKLNELGKMHEATEMRTRGREGWLRMLKTKDFKHEYTILSRAIQ